MQISDHADCEIRHARPCGALVGFPLTPVRLPCAMPPAIHTPPIPESSSGRELTLGPRTFWPGRLSSRAWLEHGALACGERASTHLPHAPYGPQRRAAELSNTSNKADGEHQRVRCRIIYGYVRGDSRHILCDDGRAGDHQKLRFKCLIALAHTVLTCTRGTCKKPRSKSFKEAGELR